MRKNQILALALAISCVGTYTGCSYRKIDNAVKEKVQPVEEANTLPSEPLTVEDIIYVQVGESLPDYYAYSGIEDGVKGLEYQIDGVTVYDSIRDANLNESDWYGLYDEQPEMYDNNQFVLVDVTANYKDDGTLTADVDHLVNMGFYGMNCYGDEFPELKETYPPSAEASMIYFSEHPNDGDVDPFTGNEMRKDTDYSMFKTPMKRGDTVHFQVGILASKELVAEKNVFMVLRYDMPPGDDPIYYVDVLGRYAEQGTTES